MRFQAAASKQPAAEVGLHSHTIVCVRVYCVCQEVHTYTTTNTLGMLALILHDMSAQQL